MRKEAQMKISSSTGTWVSGLFVFLGLTVLGYLISDAILKFKGFERSVTVKGLSQREYKADIVIWPIQFTVADNELVRLYGAVDDQSRTIKEFLVQNGIASQDITMGVPAITDKSAQQYGGTRKAPFRFTAVQTVTVYSSQIDKVQSVMGALSSLGKKGIVLTGNHYQSQTQYMFTRLNDIKPEMIEEATKKAREVAEKFATDSKSRLGKIKRASQGQFSIRSRDNNNPQIKRIRVVSTIEYYLSD